MRRNPMSILVAVLVSAAVAPAALAGTLKVPSDEYPTIQSAVVAAGDGDTILVGPGTYTESVLLTGFTDLTLRGKGFPVITSAGPSTLSVNSCTGVSVSGLVLEGGQDTVQVVASSDLLLTRLTIRNAVGNGVLLDGGCIGITLSKSAVENVGANGVLDYQTTGLRVEKCTITDPAGSGVALSPGRVTGSAGALVSKNEILGAGSAGVWFGGDDVTISKNGIEGAAGFGIYNDSSTATTGALVEKNRLEGTSGGILLYGAAAKVSKNTVTDAAGNGISIRGPGNLVEKNRVGGNVAYGFTIEGPDAEVVKNTVTAPTQVGFLVTSTGGALTKNTVTAAGTDGFQVTGTGNTFTGNKASGSGNFDLFDTQAPGVNTYSGNQFGTEQIGSPP